jgi:hypothetical protein
MRSGRHVQLAALRNRNLELQTTSPFSNHGSVERPTACFRHKNVLQKKMIFQKFPFFLVSPCISGVIIVLLGQVTPLDVLLSTLITLRLALYDLHNAEKIASSVSLYVSNAFITRSSKSLFSLRPLSYSKENSSLLPWKKYFIGVVIILAIWLLS